MANVEATAEATSPESGHQRERITPQAQYRLNRRLRTSLFRVVEARAEIIKHGAAPDGLTDIVACDVAGVLNDYANAAIAGRKFGEEQFRLNGFVGEELKKLRRSRWKETVGRYQRATTPPKHVARKRARERDAAEAEAACFDAESAAQYLNRLQPTPSAPDGP